MYVETRILRVKRIKIMFERVPLYIYILKHELLTNYYVFFDD